MIESVAVPIVAAGVSAIFARPFQCPSKRIAVNEDWDSFGFSGKPSSFYVPVASPERLTPLEDQGQITRNSKPHNWIKANRGYGIGVTRFQFTVHAHNGAVDVVGARPMIQKVVCLPGIALVPPPIGGPLNIRHLSVNLDTGACDHRNLGEEVAVRDLENPEGRIVTPLAVSIPSGETEMFHVEAFAPNHSVHWKLLLKLRINGKIKEELVGQEDGQPFLTLSRTDPAISARYEFNERHWFLRN